MDAWERLKIMPATTEVVENVCEVTKGRTLLVITQVSSGF